MSKVITITGELPSEEMGFTLPHEHVIVDFIGADEVGKHRYNTEEVIKVMLPYLHEIKDLGVNTFVDCTPMYLARDIEILKNLAENTKLNFLTNTGIYGRKPFIPKYAYDTSIDELAEQWIKEFKEGIEGTEIKPGFIKTAVDEGQFTNIEKKLIEAAALTSLETHLTIATHTCFGKKALQIIDILDQYDVKPHKWIFVHANLEEEVSLISDVAKRGAWIELDGVGQGHDIKILKIVKKLIDQGYQDQILLSQDAGCYYVGEPNGGEIRPFSFLLTHFIPKLRQYGISDELIDQFTYHNPSNAYAI